MLDKTSKIVFSRFTFTIYDRGIQGVTRGYNGLQEVTGDYQGLQGVTEGYKGLQGVTGGYKGLWKLFSCWNVLRHFFLVYFA